MNVPVRVVRVVTFATTLEPRRTRSVIRTRACGFTITFATTWPAIRRIVTVAVAGFATTAGTTTGVGVGGVGVGVGGGLGDGGAGGGETGGVTVSVCVTAGCPASVAERTGDPGCVSV